MARERLINIYIISGGGWLPYMLRTEEKKVMSELWPIEEKNVSGKKQVCSCEEGKDGRGRWGHEDICIVG